MEIPGQFSAGIEAANRRFNDSLRSLRQTFSAGSARARWARKSPAPWPRPAATARRVRCRRQARPAFAQRAFHQRLDGAARPVHLRRAWAGRRAIPVAPIRRARSDFETNEGSARRRDTRRRQRRQQGSGGDDQRGSDRSSADEARLSDLGSGTWTPGARRLRGYWGD